MPYDEKQGRGGSVQSTPGGAAIVYSRGARRRNDTSEQREQAKNLPVSALRGWLAGTLGLPGDIEGLARMITPGVDNTPALPTSEFYNEWLPLKTEGAVNEAATGAGNLFGGVGTGTAARGAARAGKAGARAVGQAIDAGMHGEGPLARVFEAGGAAPMYAVKPKGGNWSPVRDFDRFDEYMGGRHGPAVEAWKSKQLRKYVHNLMGTADDPLIKLEAEGKLHLTPDQVDHAANDYGLVNRIPGTADHTGNIRFKYQPTQLSSFQSLDNLLSHIDATGRWYRTPWEALSDSALSATKVDDAIDDVLDQFGHSPSEATPESINEVLSETGAEWMRRVPKDTPIYSLNSGAEALGFDHIADYLDQAASAGRARKAWAAQPDLANAPGQDFTREFIARNLDIDPDKLPNMPIQEIVPKVAEWNKYLSKAKQLADLNKGVKQVHRQYPSGHQWVELAPEGLKAEGDAMSHCVGGYCSSVESGDTQIFSLRDKDGRPAVTVEVGPVTMGGMTKSEYRSIHGDEAADEHDWPLMIRQIKGPANRAPSQEVIEMVQDFVKNGIGENHSGWDEVRDLRNADMEKLGDGYVTRREWEDVINDATSQLGDDTYDTAAKNWFAKNAAHNLTPNYYMSLYDNFVRSADPTAARPLLRADQLVIDAMKKRGLIKD